MIIRTSYDYPPIPVRDMDWSAVLDNYDGAEDSHHPIGHGRTELEAIDDLKQQLVIRAYDGFVHGDLKYLDAISTLEELGDDPKEAKRQVDEWADAMELENW